jgi:hypothetical protein
VPTPLDAGHQSVGSWWEVGARILVTSWAACRDLLRHAEVAAGERQPSVLSISHASSSATR